MAAKDIVRRVPFLRGVADGNGFMVGNVRLECSMVV